MQVNLIRLAPIVVGSRFVVEPEIILKPSEKMNWKGKNIKVNGRELDRQKRKVFTNLGKLWVLLGRLGH